MQQPPFSDNGAVDPATISRGLRMALHAANAYTAAATAAGCLCADTVHACATSDNDGLVLAFSCGGSRRIHDVFYDTAYTLSPWPPEAGGCSAHSGLLSTLTAHVLPWLHALPAPSSVVRVTGHSTGGALAQLVALHLARQQQHVVVECTTFGAPRVGNDALARLAAATPNLQLTQYVAEGDPVPMLPLLSSGYWAWGADVPAGMKPGPQTMVALPSARYLPPSAAWPSLLHNASMNSMDHYIEAFTKAGTHRIGKWLHPPPLTRMDYLAENVSDE